MGNIRNYILVILQRKNHPKKSLTRLLRQFIIGLLFLLLNFACWAVEIDGITIGTGYGVNDIKSFRIGLQKNFLHHWRRSEADNWPITGYWELSFYHLQGKKRPRLYSTKIGHGQLSAITLAPVFRLQNMSAGVDFLPYFELAVGLSLISNKEIAGRELGINFQFEDRLSVGVRFGSCHQYDINYRIVHFSNAYIGPFNHGLNIHFLTFGYWFN